MKIGMYCMTMLMLAVFGLIVRRGRYDRRLFHEKVRCHGQIDDNYRLYRRKRWQIDVEEQETPNAIELMSSDDLKPHVGHKVSVTGMMQGDSAMSDDKMSTDSMSKDRMSKDSMAASGFKVTSMNMASEQCAVPDAMMKKQHIAIKMEADRLRVIRY